MLIRLFVLKGITGMMVPSFVTGTSANYHNFVL